MCNISLFPLGVKQVSLGHIIIELNDWPSMFVKWKGASDYHSQEWCMCLCIDFEASAEVGKEKGLIGKNSQRKQDYFSAE